MSLLIWLDSCLLLILKGSISELQVLRGYVEWGTPRCDALRNHNKEGDGESQNGASAHIAPPIIFPSRKFFQENF
jgi:hypothetical protein